MFLTRQSEEHGEQIRFSILLGSLVIAVVIGPLLEQTQLGEIVQVTCLSLVFLAAVLVNWRSRVRFSVVGTAAIVGLSLHWASLVFTGSEVSIARFVGGFLFLALTASLLMRSIIVEHQATPNAILGSICIYLIMGLMWALGYEALTYIEAEPFAYPKAIAGEEAMPRQNLATLLYFSFVTMSTLGYGDITPQTDLSRTLTWTQSVTGQFYLAVLVARLVSVLPQSSQRESTEVEAK
ncbi:potassium channel family protein [Bremerella cremea]|uniref:potassium channel family protein n=1 Tax=Bremerella cremea TaxID=1031537 RepID=UPI0031ED9232